MLFRTVFAAIAAMPIVTALDLTSSATRCTTRFGYYPLPTGISAIPTWYRFTTKTSFVLVTSTSHDTVTATPSATTRTNIVSTTTTLSTTVTSTPAAITVPTPAGFIPLVALHPTAVPHFRRNELEHRAVDHGLHPLRRQTAANHTAGFSVDRDGQTSNVYRIYPHSVDCRVFVLVKRPLETVVIGEPETVLLPGATAIALSTTTVRATTTLTEILPRETVYSACQKNNVVNHIIGFTGNQLIFNRVVYRPAEGFPIENELVVNTTSAERCCIACQNTAFCAGSFFAPSDQACHLRLTQAAALPPAASGLAPYAFVNGSIAALPTATGSSGALATSVVQPFPTITNTRGGTCSAGSRSLYLGTIQGQEDFPLEYALSFSNGPCGRLSLWPIPVKEDLDSNFGDKRLALH